MTIPYGTDHTCKHGEHPPECPHCPLENKSWAPLDLGPYLRGEIRRPEPTIGVSRSDGIRFLYPGKEHSVVGEMESGKSWFALACVAAELLAGATVVYVHFEEGDPSDTIERLLALGVPVKAIAGQFRFVAPDRPVTSDRMAPLAGAAPSLVVLDGVNEGMSLHGQAIREEDGAAAFRRLVVKPFVAAGAAVLSADHVVKDNERRGRYALGSIHKGNALSGSLIMLENSRPFGRGARGVSNIYITKDRPGHLRGHGRPTKTPGKTFMGQMVVDDTRTRVNFLDLALLAPKAESTPIAGAEDPDEMVFAAVERIVADLGTANIRAVRAAAGIRKQNTDDALERLKLARRLTEIPGPRGARLFVPTVPGDPELDLAV